MDTPLQPVLPIVGFSGGILLWSRVAHLLIAASGLRSRKANTQNEVRELIKPIRRMMLLLAAVWLVIVGATLAYMISIDKPGWALLSAGVLAVPLFTVTNFLLVIRRRQR